MTVQSLGRGRGQQHNDTQAILCIVFAPHRDVTESVFHSADMFCAVCFGGEIPRLLYIHYQYRWPSYKQCGEQVVLSFLHPIYWRWMISYNSVKTEWLISLFHKWLCEWMISSRLSVVWGRWGRVPVTGIYLTCLSLWCGDICPDGDVMCLVSSTCRTAFSTFWSFWSV